MHRPPQLTCTRLLYYDYTCTAHRNWHAHQVLYIYTLPLTYTCEGHASAVNIACMHMCAASPTKQISCHICRTTHQAPALCHPYLPLHNFHAHVISAIATMIRMRGNMMSIKYEIACLADKFSDTNRRHFLNPPLGQSILFEFSGSRHEF